MSRLAKLPIPLGKTKVSFEGGVLSVAGPKGTLTKRVHPSISIQVADMGVSVSPKNTSRLAKALTGTFASHVRNMVKGVETPYKKVLILEGVGYRTEVKGKELVCTVGKSHPVKLVVPEEVTVTAEKNVITIESVDKEVVGQFAANVRRVKPPEPYLGKGFRYEGEIIRRKQGKKAV